MGKVITCEPRELSVSAKLNSLIPIYDLFPSHHRVCAHSRGFYCKNKLLPLDFTRCEMYKIWKYFEKRQVIDCVRLLDAINCWRRPCLCMYIQKWKNNSTLKWVNQLFIFWSSEFRPPNYYSIIKYVLDMGLTYHLSFDILLTFLVW